jgi:hypothetical protein
MESIDYTPLSWIPWKKLNQSIPIKKIRNLSLTRYEPFQSLGKTENVELPKLNVKRLAAQSVRTKSPNRVTKVKGKKALKVFYPVLARSNDVHSSLNQNYPSN